MWWKISISQGAITGSEHEEIKTKHVAGSRRDAELTTKHKVTHYRGTIMTNDKHL